ncbi:hypothetical protein RHA1_ro11250 (plasmid) [Rhodococcus jostii RHA1]|uniref:Uncharacterized protein n=1 Tax=Rhodococcus jostii (strain RHA1) TaxID=101510 RepID=Q0RUY9_RHOJR|nr:hypothetical protein RHA1_ro11250 [Rhodococcus jostii RHA1]
MPTGCPAADDRPREKPDRARCPVIAAGPDPSSHHEDGSGGSSTLDNVTDATRTETNDFRSLDRLFGKPNGIPAATLWKTTWSDWTSSVSLHKSGECGGLSGGRLSEPGESEVVTPRSGMNRGTEFHARQTL